MNVSGTTFENGSYGLSLYGGTGNLSNNSWSGYRQNAIVVGSSGAYGVVDNSISDSGSYLLYCSSGTMQGSGIDIVNSGTYTYSTTYYLPDGKEDYTDEYTSYGYGMYLYDCDAELEDVSVTDAWYSQAYVLYGNVELDGVTFSSHEKASTWASGDLYAYGSSSDELQLSNVSVEANDLSYYALYVGGYTATVDTATVSGASYGAYFSGLTSPTVSGLTVTGASSAGVYVSSVTDGAFTDVDSSGNAGRGMYVSSGTATFDGTTTLDDNGSEGLYTYLGTVAIGAGSVSGNGTNGLSPSATTLSLTGTSVTDNSVYGMYTTSGATVSLDGVTVSGSGSDGIYAQSSTLIAVDSASTDNGGYGLLCDGSSWSGDLDLGGNASGESWGCDGDDDDTGI